MENENTTSKRVVVASGKKTQLNDSQHAGEVIIVASKIKKYIKEKHGLNTASNVMERLSDIVRVSVDRAAESAMKDGRKTLMDRDF